jgi:hypothetical protein
MVNVVARSGDAMNIQIRRIASTLVACGMTYAFQVSMLGVNEQRM